MKPLIFMRYFEEQKLGETDEERDFVRRLGGAKKVCEALKKIDSVDEPIIYTTNKEKTIAEGYSKIIDYKEVEYFDFDAGRHAGELPIDAELLEKMTPYEFNCIEVARRMTSVTEANPRKYYYDRLRYFNDVIERNGIDFLFLTWLPHFGCDYILYALCRAKGIPTLFFYDLPLNQDSKKAYFYVAQSVEKQLEEVVKGNCNREQYDEEVDLSFYDEQFHRKVMPTPIDDGPTNIWKLRLRSFFLMRKIDKHGRINLLFMTKKFVKVFKKDKTEEKGKQFYQMNESIPNKEEKYVLFALHYQPEGTTLPLGGRYVDQLHAIRQLSYFLPENAYLYVKEHPANNFWREKKYYEEILKLKNVKLIGKKYSSAELFRDAKAVATITGSIGWEALFNEKPILMFGYYFYQYAPGVYPIRSNEDCKKAMEDIFERNAKPDKQELNNFLRKVEKGVFFDIYRKDDSSRFNSIIEKQITEIVCKVNR